MPAANRVGSRAAEATEEPARVGGRYRLGRRLGVGGEGETFEAIDEADGSRAAVKLYRQSPPTEALVRRVRGEFERLAGGRHPGVVRARDLGRHEGRLYLAMDLVDGSPLSAIAAVGDD